MTAYEVELIARRVVELLRSEKPEPGPTSLIDAAALAGRLGVSRAWVYEHAELLGARRLGRGSKARLRFDPTDAERAFADRAKADPKRGGDSSRLRDRRDMAPVIDPRSDAPLLPIKGRPAPGKSGR